MEDYKRYTSKDGATLTMSQWGGSPAELELYHKLAELEDKIDNGSLLEIPCKVGDTVYELERYLCCDGKDYWEIEEETFELWMLDLLGKTIFLTKSEAEARLKVLKE